MIDVNGILTFDEGMLESAISDAAQEAVEDQVGDLDQLVSDTCGDYIEDAMNDDHSNLVDGIKQIVHEMLIDKGLIDD
jgi:hypothetical protein